MFTENLDKKLNEMTEKINAVQSVKSVQRGTCSLGTSGNDIVVKMNKIDINKSMILLQGDGYQYSRGAYDCSTSLYISNITDTSFTISQHTSSSSSKNVSRQLIEFY